MAENPLTSMQVCTAVWGSLHTWQAESSFANTGTCKSDRHLQAWQDFVFQWLRATEMLFWSLPMPAESAGTAFMSILLSKASCGPFNPLHQLVTWCISKETLCRRLGWKHSEKKHSVFLSVFLHSAKNFFESYFGAVNKFKWKSFELQSVIFS